MTEITLQRICFGDRGTFGAFIIKNRPMFVSLEPPWKDNKQFVSCVPAGVYQTTKMYSQKFSKELFVLHNVTKRNLIEIHIGNTVIDTEGCILIGSQYSIVENAIMYSKDAFDMFMKLMPPEGFIIHIKDLNNETRTITSNQI